MPVSRTLDDWFMPSEIDDLIAAMQPGDVVEVEDERGVYLYRGGVKHMLAELVFPEASPKKKTKRGRRRRKT